MFCRSCCHFFPRRVLCWMVLYLHTCRMSLVSCVAWMLQTAIVETSSNHVLLFGVLLALQLNDLMFFMFLLGIARYWRAMEKEALDRRPAKQRSKRRINGAALPSDVLAAHAAAVQRNPSEVGDDDVEIGAGTGGQRAFYSTHASPKKRDTRRSATAGAMQNATKKKNKKGGGAGESKAAAGEGGADGEGAVGERSSTASLGEVKNSPQQQDDNDDNGRESGDDGRGSQGTPQSQDEGQGRGDDGQSEAANVSLDESRYTIGTTPQKSDAASPAQRAYSTPQVLSLLC